MPDCAGRQGGKTMRSGRVIVAVGVILAVLATLAWNGQWKLFVALAVALVIALLLIPLFRVTSEAPALPPAPPTPSPPTSDERHTQIDQPTGVVENPESMSAMCVGRSRTSSQPRNCRRYGSTIFGIPVPRCCWLRAFTRESSWKRWGTPKSASP
jgi:hypothetical protein